MMNTPTYKEVVKRSHVWTIETPCDAKTFDYGVDVIINSMQELGVNLSYDDACEVNVTDNAIIFTAPNNN